MKFDFIRCELYKETFPMIITNMSFVDCQFINNSHRLLYIENTGPALFKVNIIFRSLKILHNHVKTEIKDIILLINVNIYIAGTFIVTDNRCDSSIMHFQSCNILFSGKVIFNKNKCDQVIKLDTYLKVQEYTAISFINNTYHNNVISIKQNAEEYNLPYPFCFIQYVTINDNVKPKDLLSHFSVTFTNNQYRMLPYYRAIINLNGQKLHSQNDSYSILFCQHISNCKWLPSGPFNGYDPKTVNQQILKIHDHNCNYKKQICYCHQNKSTDCSIDLLGTVYPGQTLQTNLCSVQSSVNNTVLYAEAHNVNLLNSACKIAHRSQLINIIGNHSNTVNYTIASSIPDNYRCKLFLTATPLLNKIYDVFYVELLPCPIGFNLQGGICDCDPILPASIILMNAILTILPSCRCPANVWITTPSETNSTKYLTSVQWIFVYHTHQMLIYFILVYSVSLTGLVSCVHSVNIILAWYLDHQGV